MPPEPFVQTYDCAVMLADISGFTPLTERLSQVKPAGAGIEELSQVLNSYFGAMIDLIHAYGGDVIKFAGDALLVVFMNPTEAKPQLPSTCSSLSPTSTSKHMSWREQVRRYREISPVLGVNEA